MIRPTEFLALYDERLRRHPPPIPGTTAEAVGPVVRWVGAENGVIYSDLTAADARAVVAEQAAFFRGRGTPAEWKLFGHDRPADLAEILVAAGFVPEEPETLVAFDLADGLPGGPLPSGATIRRVRDEAGVQDALQAHEAAFGTNDPEDRARHEAQLRAADQAVFVSYVGGAPVAAGRVELIPRLPFAGLYGGGTAPAHRGRGIYRALVRARAELARAEGYRYLTVDARETSRPILERIGFVRITSTRPYVLRPGSHGTA